MHEKKEQKRPRLIPEEVLEKIRKVRLESANLMESRKRCQELAQINDQNHLALQDKQPQN